MAEGRLPGLLFILREYPGGRVATRSPIATRQPPALTETRRCHGTGPASPPPAATSPPPALSRQGRPVAME